MRRLVALPLLILAVTFLRDTKAVKIIDNGLAPPEIVHTPVSTKPRCKVFAPPLDLVFILDSSGSLRDKFQDEIDIIRRILKHVTIGKTATRVMLIQFSGTQHLEFNFEKFTDREELLAALDVLRHVSGITRIGGAFEFALQQLKTPGSGLRDGTVPKIVYLLSDGRTHDFPKDWQMADILRREIPNIDIWAYGTGDYVAMAALANYTQSEQKIVTNLNLQKLEPQFEKYHGTEICEQQPSCVKGSDKPLDLALVVDASESLDHLFSDQKKFLVERVLGNINIHPEAVRVALITYSGQAFVHFKFNSFLYGNNTSVQGFVKNIRSIKGTTATNVALMDAFDLLTSKDPSIGVREGVPKMALVLTDGHSHKSPKDISEKMRAAGIIMIAVSVTPRPLVDEAELRLIAGSEKRAFTPPNLHDFESEFMKYVGFGCDGIELPPDAKPQVRGATDVKCTEHSMSIVVRTQRALQGVMYAHMYHDEPECMIRKTDNSREIQMTFTEGKCGLVKTPTADGHGYHFNITVILQFHPLIITRADQGLDMSCFVSSAVPRQELDRAVLKNAADTQCVYRLHRYSPGQCVALDAKVGETLYHRWACDSPPEYNYLVHDCFVQSEKHTQQILDSNGCEVDQHFLETPNYSRFKDYPEDSYVFQEMSVFKFPGDGDLLFHCKISLCNMNDPNAPCNQSIPPKCPKKVPVLPVRQKRSVSAEEMASPEWRSKQIRKRQTELKNRSRRQIVETKAGYYMTLQVETRTLNVLLSESIRPRDSVKYCDIS
ncbi:von Willebrand factor type A domain protein [Caenorhabditis elegans]|uniref:von Willebrand factor type A domain protein n=2 Tax=Caenorhabditis elegans TaxID=6239 RepID=A0A164D3B2_CAEEL|nr:von Willebrand factor type A domain protein [Caenorhabditis elegans]SAP35541.1 von Willebrand factor type A domain protein [Caenorhabditis elegans]|eukprot:NP_001317785.1 CUTiclin-Like [Caenorhabditis elegans]